MSNRQTRRRYRHSQERRVWVFSELNQDMRPEQIARVLTAAALEQARLETEARAEHDGAAAATGSEDELGGNHA